jgi:hypothetical protein
MYSGKIIIDKYDDRYVENITESDVLICKKCKKYYYPGRDDVSIKRPTVYYLLCSVCRSKSNFYKHRCDAKKCLNYNVNNK